MEIKTILWREWIFFKHRFWKITLSQLVTPLLYLITFGYGVGNALSVDGKPYLYFLLPGILAMSTMRNSYSPTATRVSLTRLHEKSFECYIFSPTKMSGLAMGHILAGAFRGVYAGTFVIAIGIIAKVDIHISVWLFIVMFLNAVIFASIGFFAAMIINTHYDLNNFNNVVITPMSFLCGTFFSLEGIPSIVKIFIEFLPLTYTTKLLRDIAFGFTINISELIIVIAFVIAVISMAIAICYKEIK